MSQYLGWIAVAVLALIAGAGIVSLFIEFPDDWAPKEHRKDPYG